MPDRLTEIRARLNAATPGPWLDADYYVWGGEPRFMVVEHAPCRTDTRFIAHAPADIAWLLTGYALAVDLILALYENPNGRRMPAAERAELLAGWGVTEDDIAWAKQQEDQRNGK